MKLSDWCEKHNAGPADLAAWIDVTRQAASRYILGQRVPTPEKVVEIRSLTEGMVTADDMVDANLKYRGYVPVKPRSGAKATTKRRQR